MILEKSSIGELTKAILPRKYGKERFAAKSNLIHTASKMDFRCPDR